MWIKTLNQCLCWIFQLLRDFFLFRTMSLLLHQRSLLPNIYNSLALLPRVWSENLTKTALQRHFQNVKWMLLVLHFVSVNNNHPWKKERNFSHSLPHTLSLIMEKKKKNCEQSHCAECMRLVFLAKQKALQWQRAPRCSATIQPSCRQGGCPHTAAPPTLLLWQIPWAKRADARSWESSWKPGQCGREQGRDKASPLCTHGTVWFPSEAGRGESFCHKHFF